MALSELAWATGASGSFRSRAVETFASTDGLRHPHTKSPHAEFQAALHMKQECPSPSETRAQHRRDRRA